MAGKKARKHEKNTPKQQQQNTHKKKLNKDQTKYAVPRDGSLVRVEIRGSHLVSLHEGTKDAILGRSWSGNNRMFQSMTLIETQE